MRKILAMLIAIIAITSCNKGIAPEPEPTKVIEQVNIAPEYFVQKKNTEFNVGVQVIKNYTDADQVSLSFNGVEGTQIYSEIEVGKGNKLLFTMPAVSQATEGKLKVTIKNNQNTFTKEMTLRIVDDFNINSVWDYLNKNYMLSLDGALNVRTKTGFVFSFFINNVKINGVPYTSITSGIPFFDDQNILDIFDKYSSKRLPKSFINGLKGFYNFNHTDNLLTSLKIIQGDSAYGYYVPQNIYNDLGSAFGNPISQAMINGKKISTYSNAIFNIVTHETFSREYVADLGNYFGPGIYTVITKK